MNAFSTSRRLAKITVIGAYALLLGSFSHKHQAKAGQVMAAIKKPRLVILVDDEMSPGPADDTRRFAGIPNSGNTCFLNSLLQLLASDLSFSQLLAVQAESQVSSIDAYLGAARLHRPLKALLALVRQPTRFGNASRHRRDIDHCLRKLLREYREAHYLQNGTYPEAIPGPQQDPEEFLAKLISLLGYADQMGILLADTIRWSNEVEARTSHITPNTVLSIPIKAEGETAAASVDEAVANFFAEETVDGTAANNFATGAKRFQARSAPRILYVQLKRYAHDRIEKSSLRISEPVTVSAISFDVYDTSGHKVETVHYEPMAVVVHRSYRRSNLASGHYYTYSHGPAGWFCHDDARAPYQRADGARDRAENAYLIKYVQSSRAVFVEDERLAKEPAEDPQDHAGS